jgi:CRISPR/Cas system-associated exonuclease Cas4 (RecB family)
MGDLIKNSNFNGISGAFEADKMEEVLEAAAKDGSRQSKDTKKKSFAPSSFYDKGNGVCPRYWYYAFNGAYFEYDNTARQIANMDAGTAAGDRIAKLFDRAGLLNEAEVEVKYDDPPIYGFMDLAVTWQGEEMVGEVKTTTNESFTTRATAMKAPAYQLIQLLLYMYIFKKDKGFFVVENKNTHHLLIIPVKMTDKNREYIESVLEWMRVVYKNATEGELPTRPFTQGSFNCKSCPVRKTCWDGFEKTLKTKPGSGKDPNPGTVDLPVLEMPK